MARGDIGLRVVASLASVAYLAWLVLSSPGTGKWPAFAFGAVCLYLWLWALWRARIRALDWRAALWQRLDVHLVCLVLVYGLAVLSQTPSTITSDGCLYFGYMRSAVFDGDLEIERELEVLRLPKRRHQIVPVGPIAAWLVPYLTVYAVDHAGRKLDFWAGPDEPSTDGLTGPYIWSALITSYLIAAAGLIILHLRLRESFSPQIAFLTTMLTYSATTLVWYMIYEPSLPHAPSFGLTALFVIGSERWVRGQHPSMLRATLLGVAFGLLVLVRPQNVLFGFFLLAFAVRPTYGPLGLGVNVSWRTAAAFALPLVPMALLQGWMASALLAQQEYALVGERGYLDFFEPRWSDVLFSSWHGLFSWTPVVYLAFIGTLLYLRRDRLWTASALLVFAAMVWVNGSTLDWHGSWAYGGRRFTSTLVVLAPGLAALIAAVWRRPMLAAAPVALVAAYWNFLLMMQWNFDLVNREQPTRFDLLTQEQVRLYYRETHFFPFAFPANVLFSWREGLPLSKYDLLGFMRPDQSFAASFDEGIEPFLLDGWRIGRCHPTVFRCRVFSSTGEIAVPIDPGEASELALVVTAWLLEQTEAADLVVRVNGERVGRLHVTPSPGKVELLVPARVFRRGFNRVQLSLPSAARQLVGTQSTDTGQTGAVGGSRRQSVGVGALRLTKRG